MTCSGLRYNKAEGGFTEWLATRLPHIRQRSAYRTIEIVGGLKDSESFAQWANTSPRALAEVAKAEPDLQSLIAQRVEAGEIFTAAKVKQIVPTPRPMRSSKPRPRDETLLNTARKIQLRAIERGGAILAEVKAERGGDRRSKERQTPIGRKAAADAAGISPDQAKTMLRVNNVPAEEREQLIESPNPPAVTQLAERGTKGARRSSRPPSRGMARAKAPMRRMFPSPTNAASRRLAERDHRSRPPA